ncbi:Fur-regulated basic protein B [Salsuginibacillus halophilus]|uniref:Fur-regulated basic protein B n=1 Tax=Salsuginibacillus halophilus TaxID=517424 RepID=A0A2P8HBJ4_9BACI|nr:FbpB family small basic protein [Salsuginibacillus halophilus]PSL43589.1 Fur-regulated basic protein B [Salsuginibacillus halophilus]
MRKILQHSFDELVDENKKELEEDPVLLTEIEERLEEKQMERIQEKTIEQE